MGGPSPVVCVNQSYNTNDTYIRQIAKNLAHVLAKVVRADWPRRWPDFFPQLLQQLQMADGGGEGRPLSLQSVRAIRSLHRATKELAGKGLLADKMAFQGMAQLLFPVVYERLWRPHMTQLLQGLSSLQQQQQQVAAPPPELSALASVVKTCTMVRFSNISSQISTKHSAHTHARIHARRSSPSWWCSTPTRSWAPPSSSPWPSSATSTVPSRPCSPHNGLSYLYHHTSCTGGSACWGSWPSTWRG